MQVRIFASSQIEGSFVGDLVSSKGEWDGSDSVFYDLASEVTHGHICHILLVRSDSLSRAHIQKEEN